MKGGLTILSEVKLRVMVCDRSRYINDLWSQFGLSILIDCYYKDQERKRILFDTGWGFGPLLHNFTKMNIAPNTIDMIVLSHCHYDHTGGLKGMINLLDKFKLIAHQEITRAVYSDEPDFHYIGMDPSLINNLKRSEKILIKEPLEIASEVWVSGYIPRKTTFEKPEENVFILEDGILSPDPENDDMAIYINLGDSGIIVITGCGHAGLINTIYHGQNMLGNKKIRGLIGGFHLIDVEEDIRNKTISKLKEFEIEHIWSGHCTGWEAERKLENEFEGKNTRFFTGDEILIKC